MIIKGVTPTTLVDYPGHVATSVYTAGCNYACPYCNLKTLVLSPDTLKDVPEDDVYALLASRKGVIDGVCITGGEPLIQEGLLDFMRNIKDMGFMIKLNTNGSKPEILNHIVKEELADYISMDIKNSPEFYEKTVGRTDKFNINDIKISVDILMSSEIPYEFTTTVCRELHNMTILEDIGRWLQGARAYYLQSYIPEGDIIMPIFSAFSKSEMIEMRNMLRQYINAVEIRYNS